MAKRRQQWRVGDVFLVPTRDTQAVLAQVVGQEAGVLNSATCAFFDQRIPRASEWTGILPVQKVFSVLFVTRDLLDSGAWRVLGHQPVRVPREMFPYENLRDAGFVGAKVIGSGIVMEFLDAFYRLVPWDDWKDPHYLDGLLISAAKKPPDVLLKRHQS
jgi:hypothetical protein